MRQRGERQPGEDYPPSAAGGLHAHARIALEKRSKSKT
jgi:hypothetical protein